MCNPPHTILTDTIPIRHNVYPPPPPPPPPTHTHTHTHTHPHTPPPPSPRQLVNASCSKLSNQRGASRKLSKLPWFSIIVFRWINTCLLYTWTHCCKIRIFPPIQLIIIQLFLLLPVDQYAIFMGCIYTSKWLNHSSICLGHWFELRD